MWWQPQAKQLLISESRGDSNRCAPYKGNLIHTTHTFSNQSTYVTRTLPMGSPRMWKPFMESSTVLDRVTSPKKNGSCPNPQHDVWPIREFIPSFSPTTAIEAVGVKPSIYCWPATSVYWAHITSMWSVCSILARGVNPSVLNQYRREDTTFEVSACHITLPVLPNQWSSTFYLRALPNLRLTIQTYSTN
jgi:hypothetical protein